MKKILAIIISFILLFGIVFYKEFKNLYLLRKEVDKIYKLDWNNENIDMELKTSGNMKEVEQLIKTYYNNLYYYYKEYSLLNFPIACSDVLEISNLKNKQLINDKNKITEIYNKRVEIANKISEIVDNKYVLNLIENTNIKGYYIWVYKRYTITKDDELIKQWNNQKQTDREIYELILSALEVLMDNHNQWHVTNNKLYFNNKTILDKYNAIVDKLNEKADLKIKSIK